MLGVLLYVPDSTYKYPQKVNEVIVSLCVVFMFLYVSLRMSMSVCVCVSTVSLCLWTSVYGYVCWGTPQVRQFTASLSTECPRACLDDGTSSQSELSGTAPCCAVCCVLCGGVQCCVALWCAVLLQGLVCCGVTVCYVMSCAASEMQSIECIYRLGELCKYGYSFVV